MNGCAGCAAVLILILHKSNKYFCEFLQNQITNEKNPFAELYYYQRTIKAKGEYI